MLMREWLLIGCSAPNVVVSYPDDRGWIKCPDYKCGYEGPLSGEDGRGSEFTDPMTGEVIDLANTTATTDSKSLKHLTEVVEEDGPRGTLRVGDYLCPKCDGDRAMYSDRLGLTSLKLRFAHATTAAIGGGNTSSFEGLSPNKHQEPPNP